MSLFKRIGELKRQSQKARDKRESTQVHNLMLQRVALEERAKRHKLIQEQRARISKAQSTISKTRTSKPSNNRSNFFSASPSGNFDSKVDRAFKPSSSQVKRSMVKTKASTNSTAKVDKESQRIAQIVKALGQIEKEKKKKTNVIKKQPKRINYAEPTGYGDPSGRF